MLVPAMLRPHHCKHTQLGEVGLTAQFFDDHPVLIIFEAQLSPSAVFSLFVIASSVVIAHHIAFFALISHHIAPSVAIAHRIGPFVALVTIVDRIVSSVTIVHHAPPPWLLVLYWYAQARQS